MFPGMMHLYNNLEASRKLERRKLKTSQPRTNMTKRMVGQNIPTNQRSQFGYAVRKTISGETCSHDYALFPQEQNSLDPPLASSKVILLFIIQ